MSEENEFGIGDTLEWTDARGVVRNGFVTPYGHPFMGYVLIVVPDSGPLISLRALREKFELRKTGTLV